MKAAEEKTILKKAIAMYGTDEQMRMAQEECGELIVAISKYHRAVNHKRKNKHDTRYIHRAEKSVAEEITDVQIMLDQLKMLIPADYKAYREEKLERLNSRLMEGE